MKQNYINPESEELQVRMENNILSNGKSNPDSKKGGNENFGGPEKDNEEIPLND